MANYITGWTNRPSPNNFTVFTTSGPDITACTDYYETNGQAYSNDLGLSVGSDCTLTVVMTKNNEDTYIKAKTNAQTDGGAPGGSIAWTTLNEGTNTFNFTSTSDDVYLLLSKVSQYSEPDFSCTFDLQASEPSVLEVSTQAATEVTTSGCLFNGTIVSLGATDTWERGFCYLEGTTGTPNIDDNFVTAEGGSYEVGAYSLAPEETLTAATGYRFRAYSIDDDGTAYGNTVQMYTSGGGPVSTFIPVITIF